MSEHHEGDLELSYYSSRGFDAEHIWAVRSHYLQFVSGRRFLVELGSGRGEFLSRATAHVDRALGVDRETAMVGVARDEGLEVVEADALAWLETTTERPDVLFAAHLVEHLTVEQAERLFAGAARVLEPGGLIVVVTPNPACLSVLLHDFWSDPTHVRIYTLDLLRFLAERAGLEVIEAAGNPLDRPGPPPDLVPADELTGWGLPTTSVEEQARIAAPVQALALADEVRRLRRAVESLVHDLHSVAGHLDAVRHQAAVNRTALEQTLKHLYGPNEIYLVARRAS